MKKVFVCSPYAGNIEYNIFIAKLICKFAVDNGCAPFAPHLLYPQFMSEDTERETAIAMGLTWLDECDEVWVLEGRKSPGMLQELIRANRQNKKIVTVTVGINISTNGF